MITFRNLGKLGRFGNQLFQYAGTRLYAEQHGYSWAFPDWIGTSVFQDIHPYNTIEHLRARLLPTVQLSDMKTVSRLNRVQRIAHLWCQRDIRELHDHPSDNLDLYGYLQDALSLELLHRNKQKVLNWFRWQPHIDRAFRDATKGCAPWVGVHIRRGDFVRLGWSVPTSMYQEVIRRVANGRSIYLATDDAAVRQELQSQIFSVTNPLPDLKASSPNDLFDFWMLQNAATVVAGGSTFAWWAAYLSNKDTYYAPPLTHTWERQYVPTFDRQHI